ncbi:hypothetical protein AC578_9061 [Pseudocercospora eumusae]|uniref:Isochorismatase-like domain-containing protein n=1 Tax=Pseudocercospora eumusae TaxID=321146 RepID=A0A139H8S3_9PEZI|nr:hypothetical protein AC578_9061 [Pseudocercospora eumusae]
MHSGQGVDQELKYICACRISPCPADVLPNSHRKLASKMRFSTKTYLIAATAAASSTALARAASSSNSTASPGYTCYPHCFASTIPSNESATLSFGKHYAVLNLDLIPGILSSFLDTPAGRMFVNSTATWIDAPEISSDTPFAKVSSSLGTSSDPNTQVYSAFHVDEAAGDVVLQKTRYYAGAGNGLEEIFSTQKIDTVVFSELRTSGVVLNAAYQLFNLNYKVYIIANNTIETPLDVGGNINMAILEGVIPVLPADVITLEQALGALKRSGPAVY